ncbi:MAG TPA: acyl-CoA dehydrogenase family protein [Acidimicrobiales bacterium]|nr:acyl-CoA dehydrogenase family protein [Acidimicrobiales bacterium]
MTGTGAGGELDDVVDGLRAFLLTEVVPRHDRAGEGLRDPRSYYAPDGRYTPEVLGLMREVRQASARAGYYTMCVPVALGGAGLGFEALFRGWEAVFRTCGTDHWLGYQALAHWARGPGSLLAAMSPEVQEELAPGLMDGTLSMCFAMSEPDAGSDIWAMRTEAAPSGTDWVLNGTKQWITNSPYADHAVVFAVTDRAQLVARRGGITAFAVPTATPGFAVDSLIPMFGHSGADEGIVSLRDCTVPESRIVGHLHGGLRLAMAGVSEGRMYNSARAVGLARWALAKAADYAESRVTFGRPIIENQGVAFPLAESAMEVHAARLAGLDCARALDRGEADRVRVSMTKAFCTESAVRAIDRAVQVHGGMGFTNEMGLAEAWQQVRRICVADGSAEMMRRQIAKGLRSWEAGLG